RVRSAFVCEDADGVARRRHLDRLVDGVERGRARSDAPRPDAGGTWSGLAGGRRAKPPSTGTIGSAMTVCDLSSFYCEKGGGVRTYHRARIDWFAQQRQHRYVLISPGSRSEVHRVASTVWTVQVNGLRASRDPDRYRLLTDYAGVRSA